MRAFNRGVHVEAKIESLGLHMPAPSTPKGSFVNYAVVNNLIFLSGHLPQVSLLFNTIFVSNLCYVVMGIIVAS